MYTPSSTAFLRPTRGGGFEYVEYDDNAFPYPQTIGSTAQSISGLGPANEKMIHTIFIMPNKETDPDATLMIVVDEKEPSTDPKTYQYVYVGNINDLPSDVLTEGSIVNDLSTGGTDKPLSAEQGRTLNSHVNYTTCESGAADQVKLISDDGFELSTHLRLLVRMTNTNTNSTPKFNINNTGAKDVWYNGSVASDTNTWSAGEVLDIYYDGTNYVATTYMSGPQDTTHLSNPTDNSLAKAKDTMNIKSSLGDLVFKETKENPISISDENKYISSNGIEGTENGWQYGTFNVQGYTNIRFRGFLKKGNRPSISGFRFLDSNDDHIIGYQYDCDSSLLVSTNKEYVIKVPDNAVKFQTNIKGSGGLTDAFYFYLQKGENVEDKILIYKKKINYTKLNRAIRVNGAVGISDGFAISEPIFLKKGRKIVSTTGSYGLATIALTDSLGTSYTVVNYRPNNSSQNSLRESYSYTAIEDCWVVSCIFLNDTNYNLSYYEVETNGYIPTEEKNEPNGVAVLDSNGKIPDNLLPKGLPDSQDCTKCTSYPFNIPGFVIKTTGYVKKSTATGVCTEFIEINDFATYHLSGVFGVSTGIVVFYNESKQFISSWDDSEYTDNPVELKISKLDGTIPSNAKYMRVSGNTQYHCYVYSNKEDNIKEADFQEIPMTKLAQYATNINGLYIAGGINDKRVSIESTYIVPYVGATLKFKLPPFVTAWVYSGDKPYAQKVSFSSSNGWFSNGDKFTLPSTDLYFRFVFAKSNYTPNNSTLSGHEYYKLSTEEVQTYINTGELSISYDDNSHIIKENFDCEKYVKAMMRKFTVNDVNNGDLSVMPIITHATDVHGDVIRTDRFLKYSEYIKSDVSLVTGDIVAYYGGDRMTFLDSLADKYNIPVLPCLGNHDVGIQNYNVTSQEQYENIMKFYIDKYNLQTNPSELYPTYYYKDIPSKKIRIITLNSYETGRYLSSGESYAYYSQSQIDWLISSLLSTPQNYGVILSYHAVETIPVRDESKEVFYQKINSSVPGIQVGITGNPLQTIIDAFISKSTINTVFTEKDSNGQDKTINIIADFTNINSGVEFLFHINGHAHIDMIGYYNSVQMQLCLNATCLNAEYGKLTHALANASDLPRGGKGVSQDAFNIYVIDRESKTIKIARVGSNINYDGRKRDWMIIPYSN